MKRFQPEEYALPFFKEQDYTRKLCPKCDEYFWTQNPEVNTCEEATSDECAFNTFIGNPPTRSAYTLPEMREVFLKFFEKRGHTKIAPYPIVARWRSDIYLTHASIIDFQPYVTEGITPPPANPLVIAQPCIRLVDIANTGPTFGRHLTIFEMGGHHAFNYPDKEVYWKDQTVRYHHELVTEVLGVKSEEVVYKEGVWIGGGNAGPDLECIIRGLEVATLVFMQYKVLNSEFVKLPIRTVDTGYGLDRYAWLSQGTPSCFHAVYKNLLTKIFGMAGLTNIDNTLLSSIAKYSGLVSVDKKSNRVEARNRVSQLVGIDREELERFLVPIESVFTVVDHTKCLSFMLSEGIVPSNIQEGYLARLVFRRTYRLLKMLGITDKLYDIMAMQVNFWSGDYPHIKKMQNEIMEMVKIEEEKFEDTMKRGKGLVKRISNELKTKGTPMISEECLSELYDSHGLPPEIVKEMAQVEGVKVVIPERFYAIVANRHMQATNSAKEVETEFQIDSDDLPETEQLFYKDPYLKQFQAKVVKVINDENVVLDRTCFYPEGGGQPADHGFLIFDDSKVEVIDVQKRGRVITHQVEHSQTLREGVKVKGLIDWDRRYSFMRAHTATHLVNGASRRVLGEHVWQTGTQKGVSSSRLDISHFRRLKPEEVQEIEVLANQGVLADMGVETKWMPRNEAESRYGFRLYQGGVVPGKDIRVVKTGDWDVEACGGTHLKRTGEIGFIKIVSTERIQDGVERLVYSVGLSALKKVQETDRLLWNLSAILNSSLEKIDKTAEKLVKDLKKANSEKRKLTKELAAKESILLQSSTKDQSVQKINEVKVVKRNFHAEVDVNRMVQTANEVIRRDSGIVTLFYGANDKTARIMIMAGKKAVKEGVDAGKILREISQLIGGGGGGTPSFAQGGGTQLEKLEEAVSIAEKNIKKQLLN